MTVERTLARVDDDLRDGDVAMARTRLRSLVQSLPQSLEARARLADAGREVGGSRWEDVFAVGCVLTGLALVALVVIGGVTVVGWIF